MKINVRIFSRQNQLLLIVMLLFIQKAAFTQEHISFGALTFNIEVLSDLTSYTVTERGWKSLSGYNDADTIFSANEIIDRESGEVIRGRIEVWFNYSEDWSLKNQHGRFSFDVRAHVPELIRTIRVTINNLPQGELMTVRSVEDLTVNGTDASFSTMGAQISGLKVHDKWLSIGSREYPVPYWTANMTANKNDVQLIFNTSLRRVDGRKWFNTNAYHLEWYSSLDDLADDHRKNVIELKQAVVPFEERTDVAEWVKDIRLWVILSGRAWKISQPDSTGSFMRHNYAQMKQRLIEMARYFDPHKTAIYVTGWDSYYDCTTPAYKPDPEMGGEEGWRDFVNTAHEMGYHLVLHFDAWVVSFSQPEYWDVVDGSWVSYNPRFGHGSFEQMHTTNFTSLDYEPWRKIFLDRIDDAVQKYGADGVHMDQTHHLYYLGWSDSDHFDNRRGFYRTMMAIKQKYPQFVLQFELPNEASLSLTQIGENPTAHTGWEVPDDKGMLPLLFKKLYMPYIRIVAHLNTSGPHGESGTVFKAVSQQVADDRLEYMRRNDYIPTLKLADWRIDISLEKVQQYFDAALEFDERIESGQLDFNYRGD
ncbi:MAG: hypothetical protein WD577_05840 [Bacteroidales bacterium]